MSTPGPILVLGGHDDVTGALTDAGDVEHIRDLDSCLARATRLRSDGRPTPLVAVAPDVPQPLAAGRRIRSIDRSVGLAFVVPPHEIHATETKLAFVPDLTDVAVLPSEPRLRLDEALHRAAADAMSRSKLADALTTMNQTLLDAGAHDGPSTVRPVVSERYLAALTRHAPDAIVSIDPNGIVVTSNLAATTILDLPEGSSEGRRLEDVFVASDPAALDQLVRAVSHGEILNEVELAIRRADGSEALLSVTAAPVIDEADHVAGAVVLARDITERRRTDERLQHLQRSERLATLAGGVAHDFNNLLVTVQGWATIAADDVTDTVTVRTALDHIRTASERAAELARAMLAYGGQVEANPHPCDLSGLLDGMRALFSASIPRKITFELDLATDLPEVEADATQLRQVVLNLVTNAAEAIGEATGTIRIRTYTGRPERANPDRQPQTTDSDVVVLEVEDSGPGMDTSTAARIFDPFFTTKFAGRGLGLAASLGIVRAHGGDIAVDSRPGSGARFIVSFPPSRSTAS